MALNHIELTCMIERIGKEKEIDGIKYFESSEKGRILSAENIPFITIDGKRYIREGIFWEDITSPKFEWIFSMH